jgi:hypothetical protein
VGPPLEAISAEAADDTLFAAAFERKTYCDLPQAKDVLPSRQTTDAPACEAACAKSKACLSSVFISGWSRCFLKGAPGRAATVRFYAGRIEGGKVRDAALDRDHSGKDMRRVTRVRSGELCGEECLKDPKCKAFAHIGGYDDCWLKGSSGTLREKIFTCGFRPSPR